jgi:galactitol PTS system EIIB component
MAEQKRILIVCGTGIATATVAAEKVMSALKARGLNVVTSQCHSMESPGKVDTFKPHAIVATTPVRKDLGVRVFKGIPFLTGIGEQEVINQLVDHLNGVEN